MSSEQTGNGQRTVTPANTIYVKRVIGLPGERVEVRQHRAIIDGDELREPYVYVATAAAGLEDPRADWGPLTVPRGTYLLLGDHRDNSADSRVFGFVPREFLEGRVAWRYWPPERFGSITDVTAPGELRDGPDPACVTS